MNRPKSKVPAGDSQIAPTAKKGSETVEENAPEKRKDPVVRFWLAVLRAALLLGLLFYLLYHLTNGFSTEMKTQLVRPESEEQLLHAVGTVVRAEYPVALPKEGVVSYHFADGERVKAGAKLAVVYSGYADNATVARIAELDRTVELLADAGIDAETHVSDAAAATKTIAEALVALSEQIGRGSFSSISQDADALLAEFVRRDAILADSGTDVQGTLAALHAERETLAASLSGDSVAVRAPSAGYFYSHADGNETLFPYAEIEQMTPEAYRAATAAMTDGVEHALGKLVLYPRWYLLCPTEHEAAKPLAAGKNYTVMFADGTRLSMTLAAKNEGEDETLLVLSSKELPAGFDFDRTQKVSIVTDTVQGYKLPVAALRILDGREGVYIRSGNTVKFRLVEVFYTNGAYAFVRTDTEGGTLYASDADATNDIYCKGLSLYDNVIVSGARELFPDRIVN